ncbi:hypothetical protein PR001_g21862 [Phytophthora rubi]|uniref:Uncharacterized protein n=1 Tax=Phytophthora rubi TaxID=129364 RepID=A0A6A3J3H6_9STRA|nr:hypothetical protein PR001_g21862 [Phytophthora rubi]
MTGPLRWSWLIYAVFCGCSSVSQNDVSIYASLTSEGVVMIQEVLRSKYPQPALQQSQDRPPEYGFVDIQKGAQLSGRNGTRLEITRALRCRALYYPATTADSVEVVVPGYGICTTKIEDGGNNFVSDAVCPSLPSDQLKRINSLTLDLTALESEAVLMQLLSLIGGSLQWLSLSRNERASRSQRARSQKIDLCMLATTCPELEELNLTFCVVRVSAPNQALRQWAIKDISLDDVDDVSAMVTCLTDTTLRMRKTLVRLDVHHLYGHPLCPHDKKRLSAFNGEFLPVTKEKLPNQSKAAMLSAVRSGCNINSSTEAFPALSRLDASVLSLIFTFAATPEQRSIRLV